VLRSSSCGDSECWVEGHLWVGAVLDLIMSLAHSAIPVPS
jgi:hypothetical protein